MSAASLVSLLVLILALLVCIGPLGRYMAKVYGDGAAPGDRLFLPVERLIYRLLRVNPKREQRWNVYALAVLAFSLVSVLALYLFQRVQTWLPLSNGFANIVPKMAFNTSVSFVTNTNWQSYSGESGPMMRSHSRTYPTQSAKNATTMTMNTRSATSGPFLSTTDDAPCRTPGHGTWGYSNGAMPSEERSKASARTSANATVTRRSSMETLRPGVESTSM